MDCATFFLLLSILTFLYVITNKLGRRNSARNSGRLPPGPYPFPVIGNIFKLGKKPHISLTSLSKTYGPLMSVKLGSTITIVVSSPEIAKQILLEHDLSFSNRSILYTGQVVNHHLFSMVWLPVGGQWRLLRTISKQHLFSVQQLDASKLLRKEKIQKLVDYIHQCSIEGKSVNIGEAVFTTALNILSSFIFSTELACYDSLASQEFKDALSASTDIFGKPNLADYFPILKPFDPQDIFRKGNIYAEKLMSILDKMVNQRVQVRSNFSSTRPPDVLDLLLDLGQKYESKFTQNDMLHMLLDLFSAGTDTTTSTLEWAMAELLNNPEKMAKARSELKGINCNGNENMIVEESDICKFPYLNAVIKETLRLHPPAPFLLPRKAVCDVEIKGFMVPKDANILCNVWAIGRDPFTWSEPHMFLPERFLGITDNNIDYKGRDFELIPFGSGRRICPGLPLAHRMLHLMLGSLICNFDWKLVGDMDMSEKFGITLHKNVPLVAIPVKI